MNCLEFRRLTLIDPEDERVGRMIHEGECPKCAAFAREMLRQNELIREATQVEAPEGFAARILLNQSLQPQSRRPTRTVWLSLAASFLLAVALIPAIVNEVFYQPFEEGLITHLSYHDVFEHAGEASANPSHVAEVLAVANTAMPASIDNVIYASTCVIDGVTMAHLLVKNGEDEYVLMLMPEAKLAARSFTRPGWHAKSQVVDGRELMVLNHNGTNLQQAVDAMSEQFNQSLGKGNTI